MSLFRRKPAPTAPTPDPVMLPREPSVNLTEKRRIILKCKGTEGVAAFDQSVKAYQEKCCAKTGGHVWESGHWPGTRRCAGCQRFESWNTTTGCWQ